MIIEILITACIAASAVYLLYKNIKKSAAGKCSGCTGNSDGRKPFCSGCSQQMIDKKHNPPV